MPKLIPANYTFEFNVSQLYPGDIVYEAEFKYTYGVREPYPIENPSCLFKAAIMKDIWTNIFKFREKPTAKAEFSRYKDRSICRIEVDSIDPIKGDLEISVYMDRHKR